MTVLESARFFEQQTVVSCAVCGADNTGQEGHCFYCMAPLELSRSIAARGAPARFLSVLGATGAGKTVYLGMLLDMLSKGHDGLEGLPNGSFSVSVQQETITALQVQRFPEKTPSEADHWKWVHCEIFSGKKKETCADLVTPDLAGEAIALEVEQPGTYETIRIIVQQSAALMVLIDSLRAREANDEDLFAMKLISYLNSLQTGARRFRRRKLPQPVALVFTKADLCSEAMEDPARFAAANVPGLVRLCERSLLHHQFFAASVVGCSATLVDEYGRHMRLPIFVEPQGIVEPLKWLIGQL